MLFMKIYLGNISYESTETQLLELLSPFGSIVDFNYPMDTATGTYRGFAFATLTDRDIAEEAIRSLNGSDFGGRPLRVKEADKQESSPPARGIPVGFRKSGEDPFKPGGRKPNNAGRRPSPSR